MRLLDIQAALGTAILLLPLPGDAKHSHRLQHLEALARRQDYKRASSSPRAEHTEKGLLAERATCAFPTGAGLVEVTPGSSNAGWAMSPDQPCSPGNYCPFACPPGQVTAQWNPAATSYVYPLSMDGGLYCDATGAVSKPFPNSPYCVEGTATVAAQNDLSSVVAFCQTVLPGNEAMLIPTEVDAGSTVTLAVPGPSYWAGTASHFYINPPGISTAEGCLWSDGTQPIGNWAPYVAGGNTDSSGNTYFKIGWNPIWTASSLSGTLPNFGLKITCSGTGCNGLPCSIDPSTNGANGVTSPDASSGAGGADFCVVTIPPGETADIIVFAAGDSSASGSSGSTKSKTSSSTSTAPSLAPTSAKPSTAASTTSNPTLSSSSVPSSPTISAVSNTDTNTTASYQSTQNSPHVLFQEATGTVSSSSSAPTATESSNLTSTSTSPSATAEKKSTAAGIIIPARICSLGALFAVAAYLL